MNVPFCDLKILYDTQRGELDAAFRRVMESGWYILGREAEAFEHEFAEWCGAVRCAGVASGTDAVELALRAVGVEPGDAVVTVSHTAVATVAAIERMGAVPVLADVEPDRFTMSPASLERILERYDVRAVLPVHLYGQCADMDSILHLARAHGCKVVEDCAQAHGSLLHGKKAGTFGDAAAFSFYPTKNLGAFGDGGAVLVSDSEAESRVRELRQYGWRHRYISEEPGFNSRLDELQAALLRVRLARLDADNAHRRRAAERYLAGLADIPGLELPVIAPDCSPVWHLFVVRTPRGCRDALAQALAERGIASAVHYPVPVHLQPAYANRTNADPAGLPCTEDLCGRILSLPMHAHISDTDITVVCDAVRTVLAGGAR